MTTMMPVVSALLIASLVFASGWRMCPPSYAAAGGFAALLFFFLHPAFMRAIHQSSSWDALFVMLFTTAWLWTEHWSLFMRSWVLAGLFAFGVWAGSPFVLWGLAAMVPWVIFNRRPLASVGSMAIVFLGGFLFFSVSWGTVWLVAPEIGRPLFSQWIRSEGLQIPASLSLPWCLLTAAVLAERCKDMIRNHRSDAATFAAALLIVTALFGSPRLGLALVALSAPLLARLLIKREFLYHRGVRWLCSATFVLTIILAYALRKEAWAVTALSMVFVGITSRGPSESSRVPWRLSAEAICVGAYAAEFFGTLLHLFPAI